MAKVSKAQMEATSRWQKKAVKPVSLRLHRTHDADVIEMLESVDSKNGYIKELIRKDIEERKMK